MIFIQSVLVPLRVFVKKYLYGFNPWVKSIVSFVLKNFINFFLLYLNTKLMYFFLGLYEQCIVAIRQMSSLIVVNRII